MAELVEQNCPTPFQAWRAFIVASLFVLFQFGLQYSTAVMVTSMSHTFRLTPLDIGLISGAYYYIYVLLQVPCGFLIDRFGAYRLLTLSAVLAGLGCAVFATAQTVLMAELGRVLMGAGSAFAYVGTLNVIKQVFPPKRFSFFVGLLELLGYMAIGFIQQTIIFSDELVGWKNTSWGMALMLWLIAFCIFFCLKIPVLMSSSTTKRLLFRDVIRRVLGRKILFINGLYSGLVFSVVNVFAGLWGIPYFVHTAHFSSKDASMLTAMIFVGAGIGGPVIAWLSEKWQRRRVFLFYGPLCSAILMFLILGLPFLSFHWMIMLMSLLGVSLSVYLLNFPIAAELVSSDVKSTALGYTNALAMVTAPLFQPFIGLIINMLHTHKHSISSLSDYQIALSILPVLLIVSSIMAFWLPDKPNY